MKCSEVYIPNASMWSIPKGVMPQTTGFLIYKRLSWNFNYHGCQRLRFYTHPRTKKNICILCYYQKQILQAPTHITLEFSLSESRRICITTFVESFFPPRPTSIIATSTCKQKITITNWCIMTKQEVKRKKLYKLHCPRFYQ